MGVEYPVHMVYLEISIGFQAFLAGPVKNVHVQACQVLATLHAVVIIAL